MYGFQVISRVSLFIVAFRLLMFISIFAASAPILDISSQSGQNLGILPPQVHTWPP